MGLSLINQPAIGVPPFMESPILRFITARSQQLSNIPTCSDGTSVLGSTEVTDESQGPLGVPEGYYNRPKKSHRPSINPSFSHDNPPKYHQHSSTNNGLAASCDHFTIPAFVVCIRVQLDGHHHLGKLFLPAFSQKDSTVDARQPDGQKVTKVGHQKSAHHTIPREMCKCGMISCLNHHSESRNGEWLSKSQAYGSRSELEIRHGCAFLVQPKSNRCPSLLLISNPCSPARRCSISGFCPAMSFLAPILLTHRVRQAHQIAGSQVAQW